MFEIEPYCNEIETVQKGFAEREFLAYRVESETPQLIIDIPEAWESVLLAPLYDVHIGSREFDEALFLKHRDWIRDTPNVVTWNGGDLYENLLDPKMGHTPLSPEEQIAESLKLIAPIQHKLLFSIPGNHENRTGIVSGTSSARRLADYLKLPYFRDYCFLTVRWRGNNFRILVHHGAGGAQSAGGQRNAARKELTWAQADMLWTGHMHQPLVDVVSTRAWDQSNDTVFERDCVVVVSPSYLKYFGGYAASKRMNPGGRGLAVAALQDDGRIDVLMHARGKRL